MSIVCFPRYSKNVGSSRVRTYSIFEGVSNEIYPFFDNYRYGKKISLRYYLSSFVRRLRLVLRCNKSDTIIIEKELLPGFPWWLEVFLLRNKNWFLDYDDAVWANSMSPWKYVIIAKHSMGVFAGSVPILNFFKPFNANVSYIPSSVHFVNRDKVMVRNGRVLWSGSTTTSGYLYNWLIKSRALVEELSIGFNLIGTSELHDWDQFENIERIDWSLDEEERQLSICEFGIMPMERTYFSIFKCSYKSLMYAANGLVVFQDVWGQNRWFTENFEIFNDLADFSHSTDFTVPSSEEFNRLRSLVDRPNVRDLILKKLSNDGFSLGGKLCSTLYITYDVECAEKMSFSHSVLVPKNKLEECLVKVIVRIVTLNRVATINCA